MPEELSREDMQIMDVVDPHKTLVVLNKTDLDVRLTKESIADDLEGAEIVETSMVDATGVDMLEEAIVNRVYAGDVNPNESCMVTNVRHKDLLQQAGNSVSDALGLVALREPLEIIEIDVNSAYEALGEITGEAVSDDILNEVFSRFCLGK
jgi:tRNA modification GTPase